MLGGWIHELTVTLAWFEVTVLPSLAASMAVAVAELVTEPAVTSESVVVYVAVHVTFAPGASDAGVEGQATITALPLAVSETAYGGYSATPPILVKTYE